MGQLSELLSRLLPRQEKAAVRTWHVGARYTVVQPISLVEEPDFGAKLRGRLQPNDVALVLALTTVVDDDGEEVLVAYLASTKTQHWVTGWGQIAGPKLDGPASLACRVLPGSWEVGGRYRVAGNPVLRATVELEGEPLCELQKDSGQEVLILELGLVICEGEPRLRGRARTDAGCIGWLTIELPGTRPLLEALNLYSKEAITSKGWIGRSSASNVNVKSSGERVTISGTKEQVWEVGGKYRTLKGLTLEQDAAFNSKSLVSLRAGKLVAVKEIRDMTEPSGLGRALKRFKVVVETGRSAGKEGWVSSTDFHGETILDFRNQMEFEDLLRTCVNSGNFSEEEALTDEEIRAVEFEIELRRTPGTSLGVQVDHSDGQFLVVESVIEHGLLMEWNVAHPERAVQPGDRIFKVNDKGGSSEHLLAELSLDGDKHVRILRILAQEGFQQEEEAERIPEQEKIEDLSPIAPAGTEASSPEKESSMAEYQSFSLRGLMAAAEESAVSLENPTEEHIDPVSPVTQEVPKDDAEEPKPSPPTRSREESNRPDPDRATLPSASVCKHHGSLGIPKAIRISEEGTDCKLFLDTSLPPDHEDLPVACPCREEGLLSSFFGCGGNGGHEVTNMSRVRGHVILEPAPEPRPGRSPFQFLQ
eukprot:TRINITY_DN852_c1_g2_i1.p1 TRINITY_DN852_c1_g2~~TRINITY_DN852_c1_g2_i1.p1  ORF type:complete len:647 (+),score=128.82 TRINITY_DN852_c1_g2_i1:31-1971(+)